MGWFFVQSGHFGPFNASGGSLYSGIGIAAGVALFSFIGVEFAAITAKRVKNPRKNVGRASILGTGASAILYLAVSAAVMGLVAHHALVGNGAPFVAAFQTIFIHGAWAGKLVAALAVVSGIGALNGWTLVTAEMSRAAAKDGLFPAAVRLDRPQGHRLVRHRDGGSGAVAADAVAYTTKTGLTVFTDLVDLTVVTVAIPYLFSACAQLAYLVSAAAGCRAGCSPGPVHRRRRAVLAVGHLRRRVPGRLPGAGDRAGRRRPLRLLEGPRGAPRPGPEPSPADSGEPETAPADHDQEAAAMSFNVRSEVGQLRQAIVHRPGLELSRLTPQNIGGLLFDDVMWAKKAKEEHDVFAEALRDQGVQVHYFGQLLAETLEHARGPGVRARPRLHPGDPRP